MRWTVMPLDDFLSEQELVELGFAAIGHHVRISRHALFFNPHRISVGDHSRIDAFSILAAGEPHLKIGRHVHISAYVAILGRSAVELQDFCGLSARVTVFTSTDDFSGSFLTGPTVAEEFRAVLDAPVVISEHVVVGAGTIVLPGVTIGRSAAVGAASLVSRDVLPHTLVAGVPARRLRDRSHEHVALAAAQLARDAASGGPGSE